MSSGGENYFSMVSDHEEDQRQLKSQRVASYCELFRFATNKDYILMLVGTICAFVTGGISPVFMILWGQMTSYFNSHQDIQGKATHKMLQMCCLGVVGMITALVMYTTWMVAGERQAIRCRKQYLKSLLKQEIGWFDTIDQSSVASQFAVDCQAFQGAIGQKLATLIVTISMFISGLTISLMTGWFMTLALVLIIPAIASGGSLLISSIEYKANIESNQYSKAAGKVEQAINAIKTVKQFNGQEFQTQKYTEAMESFTEKSFKLGAYEGLGMGLMYFFVIVAYGYGFWFGTECKEGTKICQAPFGKQQTYTTPDIITIFYCTFMAGMNLVQLSPSVKKITLGRVAAARIFQFIDRQPSITSPDNGIIPEKLIGIIRFENVSFAYPKDKSKLILNRLNLQISTKSSAFVGDSGCGKSTVFQLLMRFYDPDEGKITLDGIDLRDLDLKWLRQQMGYVGQEPVLFATTIRENLLFGKEDATEQEIVQALSAAQALNFINQLENKLQTYVGIGGGQLSGGQKQRIAIARALLKKPKILLLDEATSALDRQNERLIQATLDHIEEDKITITIAHRINTIQKCEQIFVMESGGVAQKGKFKGLQRFKGIQFLQEKSRPQEKAMIVRGIKTLEKSEQRDIKEQMQVEQAQQELQQQQLLQKYGHNIFSRIFAYAQGNRAILALGIVANITQGMIYPFFSIFLGRMMTYLIEFDKDPVQARKDANSSAIIIFLLAVVQLIVPIIYSGSFSYVGQCVSVRIRSETYHKILKMPVGWFDKPKNKSGSLSAQLQSDCSSIKTLITTFISVLLQDIAVLTTGLIIAFLYEWRTALISLGLLPLLIFIGGAEINVQHGIMAKTSSLYKSSAHLISEVVNNIRTVTSFDCHQLIENSYEAKLAEPLEYAAKKGLIAGFLFGISEMLKFTILGLTFYIGVMVSHAHPVKLQYILIAVNTIAYSAITIGNTSYFIPDFARAKAAAVNIFNIQDSRDEDQIQIQSGSKMLRTPLKGNISIENVSFTYQSRNNKALDKISLDIRAGTKVGFVGPSGCGKSTLLQLLLRFYDCEQGTITIDGVDLKDYDIHHLRSNFGVVGQQPVLFNDTIGNNIRYNRSSTSQEQIVDAANQANFNPDKLQAESKLNQKLSSKKEERSIKDQKKSGSIGFDKMVGVKGGHISGGQKQRVAIARVIIRKPKILLLDEATSALDAENQRIVQKSLDKMMFDKTSLVVAHRVSTIRQSNMICVFEKGRIAEQGTYQQLMRGNGYLKRIQKGLYDIEP